MSAPPLVLRTLDQFDPRWDRYVEGHDQGSFFHLHGWKRVIERAFSLEPHYLYAERAGALVGVVPLFASGGRPFSRALVSVPVGVSGGVLADDEQVAAFLLGGARAVAERKRLSYVELKSEKRCFMHLPTKADLYVTFRQELFRDREEQLGAIPRKTRAIIREAERARLRAEFNRADLDSFYDLYALSLRNLGTPMFPKMLFEAALEEFPRRSDILVVRQMGRIVGAVLNFYYKETMLPFFAGALPEARDVGINNYLYWAMLESGRSRGYRVFDFGRSKRGTGAYRFKRHFGMTEQSLEYQYDLVSCEEMPNVNPTNAKYEKAIQTWQKLPVEVSKWVGPLISRRIP